MESQQELDRIVRIGKVPFKVASVDTAVSYIFNAISFGHGTSIRLSNGYCVAIASRDSAYENLLNGPGVNFPDGAPIAWFMRKADKEASQVRGPSLFQEALRRGQDRGINHFFLGSTELTLEKLETVIIDRYDRIKIAGSYSPPFGPIDELFHDRCVAAVQASSADIVWVALGTPKQDFVAQEIARRTGKPCVAVGAAFDFTAGTVKEAPLWTQRNGLEWAYRLTTEPRRLWRRYLLGNLEFLYSVVVHSKR